MPPQLDPSIILNADHDRIVVANRELDQRRQEANQRLAIDAQEADLRRQEIMARRDELIDRARERNQPKEWEPNKANQALTYQQSVAKAVYGQLKQVEAHPETWGVARQRIGQWLGLEALGDLPENVDEAMPSIKMHIASYPAEAEKATQMNPQFIRKPDPEHPGQFIREVVQPKVGDVFPDDKTVGDIGELTKSSIAVQAADALRRGDKDEYKRLLQVQREVGMADDRPATTIRMANGMTPGQAFSSERQLRNDFSRETKSAQTVAQQLALMESSLKAVKEGKAAAGSQGVLVTFQKILDPTSVVRESEYARSASGLSLLGQIEGKWDQIRQGGAGVTAADLDQFVTLARAFNKNQQAFAKQTRDQINAVAKEYGLDPSRITKDTDVQTPRAESPVAPGTSAAPAKPPTNPFRK